MSDFDYLHLMQNSFFGSILWGKWYFCHSSLSKIMGISNDNTGQSGQDPEAEELIEGLFSVRYVSSHLEGNF